MKRGGNRKPQQFRQCGFCKRTFGPIDRLSAKFCSVACKNSTQTTGRIAPRYECSREARAAHSAIAFKVKSGKIIRPASCESCRKSCKPEGAHFNYSEPLRVRWLCVSCH